MVGDLSTGAAVFAQQPQDDRETVVDGQQRREPAFEVVLPRVRIGVQPVVIRRQVEFANTAR